MSADFLFRGFPEDRHICYKMNFRTNARAVLQAANFSWFPMLPMWGRNRYSSYISLGMLALNLLLKFVLIHFLGITSVAATNLFSAMYEPITVFWFANCCILMPWTFFFYRIAPALRRMDSRDRSGS